MDKLKHYLPLWIIPHTASILFSHNHDKQSSKKATATILVSTYSSCQGWLSVTSLNALAISTKWTHFPKHKTYSHDFAYESKIKSRSTQMAHCTYSFPSKCGTNYLHQTGKPLPMNCLEVETKLKTGLLWEPIFVQHAYQSLQVHCIAAKTLHTDSNTSYSKHEISTNGMMRKCHQPRLGFSHVQIPLIARKWISDRVILIKREWWTQ